MKLEFESNTTSFPSVENDFLNDTEIEKASGDVAKMLNAGIKAAQEGRRAEAKNMLLQVTELDPENENAWLWLASISEYPEELLVFLNSVLKINPANERALDWVKATRTLLSKTFIQRGIDASKEVQKDFARQCFLQALVHDNQNEMAWLWLASVSDSDEEKTSHLQKVLDLNPENQMAQASLKAFRKQMAEAFLQKAGAWASAGDNAQAHAALQEVFKKSPEMEDAWILKSFLVESLGEKLACFEKIIELNPANRLAQVNAAFLRALPEKIEAQETDEPLPELIEEMKSDEAFFDAYAPEIKAGEEDKNPTAELEYPPTVQDEYFTADEPPAEFDESAGQVDWFEMEEVEFAAPENVDETDVRTEFSAGFEESEALENSFAAEASSGAWRLTEETPDEAPEIKSENEIEDFSEVEEIPQVYAFQEAESTAQPATAEDAGEVIDETDAAEAVDYYADQEASENEMSEASAADEVYEIEADAIYADEFENPEDVLTAEAAEPTDDASSEMQPTDGEAGVYQSQAGMALCPFCEDENEQQAFVCRSCHAVLSLSDLELLLAHQEAHQDIVGDTIDRIEKSKVRRDLETEELKVVAIGYFNLKDPKKGILYLSEAARLDPDDIVLSSQVNALKIRLSEIEKQESTNHSMPKNRQILVVDDSATVRKLISSKLEKCGHEVICAIDGVDALEKLSVISPDLILLDINMPRMDGYQVCKLIRGNDLMKDTPVVMISGKDGFFDKVRGRMAGTTGYITKPFGPETLMKTVETYIVQPA